METLPPKSLCHLPHTCLDAENTAQWWHQDTQLLHPKTTLLLGEEARAPSGVASSTPQAPVPRGTMGSTASRMPGVAHFGLWPRHHLLTPRGHRTHCQASITLHFFVCVLGTMIPSSWTLFTQDFLGADSEPRSA